MPTVIDAEQTAAKAAGDRKPPFLPPDLADQIELVKKCLYREAQSISDKVAAVLRHQMEGGGKFIRPLLVLLSARMFSDDLAPAVPVAAAAEMIHLATLAHDDVIDGSDMRRRQATINALWGNQAAILAGDILLARALVILSRSRRLDVVQAMAAMLGQMCEGEIAQHLSLHCLEQSEKDYEARIERKTACFFAACCRVGALLSGAGDEDAEKMSRFGSLMGMAFQVADDIMDITSAHEEAGKPVRSDLAQGILTLPVIYALKQPEIGRRIRELLAGVHREKDPAVINEVLALVCANGALEYARSRAKGYVREAEKHLPAAGNAAAKEALRALAGYAVNRVC
ncbi:MAG TPA: polyprenyl synthetase family protein [Firmicutes bacterium]|nr:polyprenyl synthetase family protein [Bacillota bacterium]